jgi:hypothetical protein
MPARPTYRKRNPPIKKEQTVLATEPATFDWENSVEAKLTKREERRQLEREAPVQKTKDFLKNLFRSKKPAAYSYE